MYNFLWSFIKAKVKGFIKGKAKCEKCHLKYSWNLAISLETLHIYEVRIHPNVKPIHVSIRWHIKLDKFLISHVNHISSWNWVCCPQHQTKLYFFTKLCLYFLKKIVFPSRWDLCRGKFCEKRKLVLGGGFVCRRLWSTQFEERANGSLLQLSNT